MRRIVGIIGLAGILSMISCSKSAEKEPRTPSLVVDLHASALSIENIDSADVVFRKTGTNIRVRQPFTKKAQGLVAALRDLTPGTWNADIAMYTKTINRQSDQYVMIKPVLITDPVADVSVAGPGATSGNGWLKRHVKASAGNEVVVIVPDEVYDPYFEIRTRLQEPLALGIQREAINVNFVVDQKNWACTNACFDAGGSITDINHFMPFTQTILSEPWTRNVISIAVYNSKQEALLTYDHTWNQ